MFPMTACDLSVKVRQKHIIGPINLTISEGGITVLMGPNGAGKTTLLKGAAWHHPTGQWTGDICDTCKNGTRTTKLCVSIAHNVAAQCFGKSGLSADDQRSG